MVNSGVEIEVVKVLKLTAEQYAEWVELVKATRRKRSLWWWREVYVLLQDCQG